MYSYLAEGVGRKDGSGAFRSLKQGFKHWASGRLSTQCLPSTLLSCTLKNDPFHEAGNIHGVYTYWQ